MKFAEADTLKKITAGRQERCSRTQAQKAILQKTAHDV